MVIKVLANERMNSVREVRGEYERMICGKMREAAMRVEDGKHVCEVFRVFKGVDVEMSYLRGACGACGVTKWEGESNESKHV